MQTESSKIEVKITNLALVVACANNTPSVINPDFLRHRNVVPASREVVESACISTPVFSRIEYQGAFAVTCEEGRITVLEQFGGDFDVATAISPSVANRLLAQLPNVQCNAVGINPTAEVQGVGASKLKNIFRQGPWQSYDEALPDCSASFSFKLCNRVINVELSSNKVKIQGSTATKVTNLVILGNFHHGISSQHETNRIAKDIISSEWSNEVGEFSELAHSWASLLLTD